MLCWTGLAVVPEKQVGQQAVPVRAHRHQVAAFLLNPFDDFPLRVAVGQFGLGGNAGGFKLGPDLVQIRRVFCRSRFTARVRAVDWAAQPSATWSNTTRLWASFASCLTCSMMARSVGVPSNVTRMVLYMGIPFLSMRRSSAGDDLPRFARSSPASRRGPSR